MKNGYIFKTSLLLSLFLALFISVNAQDISVSGRLIDSASTKPVDDATISFQELDKKISKTIVSKDDGSFQTTLAPGKYRLTITHGSFRRINRPLKVEGGPIDLGTMQMITMVKNMAEVTIVAQKPMVEQMGDRLIYNVEEDPTAKSESASDILRKTPYVTVDGEGGIQVNGQTNFRVLLNGRETALFSQNVKDALKSFPGATISKIEVITSPSAKYDAEGVGGIINIITKKLTGYNGSINTNANTIGHRSAGMNINMKSGKLGVSGLYSFNTNPAFRTYGRSVTTPNQSTAFQKREVAGPRVSDFAFHQGNLELSYDVDSTNTVVVYGNFGRNRNEMLQDQTISTIFSNGTEDIAPFLVENSFTMPSYGFGSDFIRKYKGKPQKELSVRFNAIFNTNRSEAFSQQGIGTGERFIMNNSESINKEYTAQIDFVEPINKTTRLETGLKAILRNASSDFGSMIKYSKAAPYEVDPSNSNKFSYDQNVYGGYVSLSKNIKKLTSRLGLRVEHTQVDGEFTSTATTVKQRYTTFIPNLMLMMPFSKTMTSNFTYTFRLGRPNIQSLNPFVNNVDSLYRQFGNPDLGPQYVHQFAWQNRFFKGNKFISINLGYNFSNTLIIQNPTFDPATGITSVTSANAGQIRDFSVGFVSNLPVGQKWNIAVNATTRFARIRNLLQTPWSNATAANFNGNVSFKATPLFTITSNGGYFIPLRMPNTTFPDNYFYGMNFVYKLFKQKLTATATIQNFIEKDRTMRSFTENQSFITENYNTVPMRNFGLALSYNFGTLKEKVSKKKGINNDDDVQ